MGAITVENLTKTYMNGVRALVGASFAGRQGEIFGLRILGWGSGGARGGSVGRLRARRTVSSGLGTPAERVVNGCCET